jgi:hypothetical protein
MGVFVWETLSERYHVGESHCNVSGGGGVGCELDTAG